MSSTEGAQGVASVDPDPLFPERDTLLGRSESTGRSTLDAARALEGIYGDARFRVEQVDEPFRFQVASLGDAHVTFRQSTITGPVHGDVHRLDGYVATWFRSGAGSVTTSRGQRELPTGQPTVLPSAARFSLEATPARQSLVHVARPFLDRVATERHGGSIQSIAFRADAPLVGEAAGEWRRILAAVMPLLTAPESTPLVRMESNLRVARGLLDLFPWHAQQMPPALLVPRLARIRQSVEYLHENAHLPISPADAAEAVGLHTRSLQGAFQRHLGMSPTEYLRSVRLDRVRMELLHHTPLTATVKELAEAWGFGNQGRFAAVYQERFAEKPNETLRRIGTPERRAVAAKRHELSET